MLSLVTIISFTIVKQTNGSQVVDPHPSFITNLQNITKNIILPDNDLRTSGIPRAEHGS